MDDSSEKALFNLLSEKCKDLAKGETHGFISCIRMVESVTHHELVSLRQRLHMWRDCTFSWALHSLPLLDFKYVQKFKHLLPAIDKQQIAKDVGRTTNWLEKCRGAPSVTSPFAASVRQHTLNSVLRAHAVRSAILSGHVQVRCRLLNFCL